MKHKIFLTLKNTKSILFIAIWVVCQLIIASRRSFWCDEWFRVDQMYTPLLESFYSTIREPSPFALGEIFLAWISSKLFFFLPTEVWSRLPSILFGALTLNLSFEINKKILSCLLFFSVTLTAMSTQFRSYAALIYGGAVAFLMMFEKEEQPKNFKFHEWFAIIFGHFFGIFYVSVASFLKKKWLQAIVGFGTIVIILIYKHIVGSEVVIPPAELPPFIEILKQTLGTVSNPQKVVILFFPIFLIGLFSMYKNEKRKIIYKLFIFSILFLVPIVAISIKKYFFLPRVMSAGVFPFLFIVNLGIEKIGSLKLLEKYKNLIQIFVCVVMSIPWILFLQGVPPFIDQPLHRVHLIVNELKINNTKQVLNLDYLNEGSVQRYFDIAFKDHEKETLVSNKLIPFSNRVVCWKGGPCLTTVLDEKFGWSFESETIKDPNFLSFIDENKYEAVIHGVQKLKYNGNAKLYRAY